MSIKKLDEFAVNGDKSISGLTLTTGFPRQQKPYRQWMNYLFNWLSKKTNEVVDDVNDLNVKVAPLLEPIHVGELFVTTTDYDTAAQVATRHGYGTWQRFAEGKTLVGYSSSESDIDDYRIMGNEFGENTHKLNIDEMPRHNHRLYDSIGTSGSQGMVDTNGSQTSTLFSDVAIGNNGGNQPHNNIQPSIVVAYWLRVG